MKEMYLSSFISIDMEKSEKLTEENADASKVQEILEKNGIVDIRSFIQQTRNEVQTTRQDDPSSPSSPSGHDYNIYRLVGFSLLHFIQKHKFILHLFQLLFSVVSDG